MLEVILARVLRCLHCQREMQCSALEYDENPFCAVCLPERIAAATPPGGVAWRARGAYLIPEAVGTPSPSARKRHRA